MKLLVLPVIAVLGLTMPAASHAQAVNVEDIVNALRTDLPGRGKRGITVLGGETDPPPAIDMRIAFEYNEARLTTEAQLALKALATALSDARLSELRFEIIGHTDARGSDSYNDDLSERRALAVVSSLSLDHGIDAGRLVPSGRGEQELLVPSDPESGENRRVEIRTIVE